MIHKHDWRRLVTMPIVYFSKRDDESDRVYYEGTVEMCFEKECSKKRFIPDNPNLRIVEVNPDNMCDCGSGAICLKS